MVCCKQGRGATFHVDHIIPRSVGGATTLDNLALQCPACSLRKSNKMAAVDSVTGEVTTLLHPLRQTRNTHIRLHNDGTCEGLTAVGRVTVYTLHMNDPLPRMARALQRMDVSGRQA